MNWAIDLSASAVKELKKLPRDRQRQIERAPLTRWKPIPWLEM
jgi:mRNA-degrading endonuclease RelE of RelBE toxin-antitoxin system